MTENECIEVISESKRQAKIILENPTLYYSSKDIVDGCATMNRCISAYEAAINALEEIQRYRAIGTVEECREARERQMGKKPIEYEDKYYGCPVCDNPLMYKWEKYPTRLNDKKNGRPYCLSCGQKLDWSE